MRLSNVVKAELAEEKVLDFVPQKFEQRFSSSAKSYIELKKTDGTDFKMSDVIRMQTGIDEVEMASIEEQVEARVLERLKEVQENAYLESYQLGLDDGKKEAYKQADLEIQRRMSEMDELIESLKNLKMELYQHNESHLVRLAYHIGARLAAAEIQANPELIKDIVKQCLELSQSEEDITISVNPIHLEFLESLKQEVGREFDFLKKVKFEPDDNMKVGGCTITTNYGEIDARFEERVSKLWSTLEENLYKVKTKITAA